MKITKTYLKQLIKEELTNLQKKNINAAKQNNDQLAGKTVRFKNNIEITIINSREIENGYVQVAVNGGDIIDIPIDFLQLES